MEKIKHLITPLKLLSYTFFGLTIYYIINSEPYGLGIVLSFLTVPLALIALISSFLIHIKIKNFKKLLLIETITTTVILSAIFMFT